MSDGAGWQEQCCPGLAARCGHHAWECPQRLWCNWLGVGRGHTSANGASGPLKTKRTDSGSVLSR